jgi:tetratricopeptide (TPR) repeat protein
VLAGVLISLSFALPCGVRAVPSDPRAALTEVQQLIEKGDYTTARKHVIQALKEFPNEPALYNFMGVVEVQSGDYRAVEGDFRKAIDLATRFTGAYLNLSRLLQEHADQIPQAPKKVLEAYQRLLKHEPGNLEANYQSAYLLQLQGSYPSSLAHLARLPADMQRRAQALAVRCADYAEADSRPRNSERDQPLYNSRVGTPAFGG